MRIDDKILNVYSYKKTESLSIEHQISLVEKYKSNRDNKEIVNEVVNYFIINLMSFIKRKLRFKQGQNELFNDIIITIIESLDSYHNTNFSPLLYMKFKIKTVVSTHRYNSFIRYPVNAISDLKRSEKLSKQDNITLNEAGKKLNITYDLENLKFSMQSEFISGDDFFGVELSGSNQLDDIITIKQIVKYLDKKNFSDIEKEIFIALINEDTERDLAVKFNVSHQYINQIKIKLMNSLKKLV